jgi:uncharacterized protein HemX
MNNENSLESEFLVYAAKAELKEQQEMTEPKTDLEMAKLEDELATVYRQMAALKRELLAKDEKIDALNQEIKELKGKDDHRWRTAM